MSPLASFSLDEPVPVFPLNGSVLLPYSVLPLHIFEPRYRSMVEDALDATGLLAMGAFAHEVPEEQYLYGSPPLKENVGLGFLEEYKELEDGRFAVLLRGLVRAKIEKEVESLVYRRVLVRPVSSILDTPERMDALRARLLALLGKSRIIAGEARESVMKRAGEESMERLVDELGGILISDPETLEMLLDENDVATRAECIIDHLETAITAGLG